MQALLLFLFGIPVALLNLLALPLTISFPSLGPQLEVFLDEGTGKGSNADNDSKAHIILWPV